MSDHAFRPPQQLRPSAMEAVALRRYDDAIALLATGQNARANGAAYLCGFAIEILLKAQLVRRFPVIARKRSHELLASDREVWALIWRQHDLDAMLNNLPHVEAYLIKRGERDGVPYLAMLKKVCQTWTVFVRYSTRTISMQDARDMVASVDRVKEFLRHEP